jgi:VanZ family protein
VDEWRQSFVPSRTGSLGDVLIDATGAGLGLLTVCAFLNWRARRRAHSLGA